METTEAHNSPLGTLSGHRARLPMLDAVNPSVSNGTCSGAQTGAPMSTRTVPSGRKANSITPFLTFTRSGLRWLRP